MLLLTCVFSFLMMLCITAGQFRTNLSRFGHCFGFFHGFTSNSTVRRRRRRSIAIHCDGVDRHDVVDWFYVENQCTKPSGGRNSGGLRHSIYGFHFNWVVCVGGCEWVVHSSQDVAVLCSLLCQSQRSSRRENEHGKSSQSIFGRGHRHQNNNHQNNNQTNTTIVKTTDHGPCATDCGAQQCGTDSKEPQRTFVGAH